MPQHNVFASATSLASAPRQRLGGTCSITYFQWDDVATWPDLDPVTGKLKTAVVLKAGKTFFTLSATERDRIFSETWKRGIEGPYCEMQVAAKLAGSNAPTVQALDSMKFHQWGIIAKERTGDVRLLGNADCGALFSWNYTSGDYDTSRMIDLKWTWQHPNSAPFYEPV